MLALFGGTFNPIHLGHLNIANRCVEQLKPNQVSFMPSANPVHKMAPEISDQHRVAMLKTALMAFPHYTVDSRELERKGPSYTVLSLRELKQEHPKTTILFLLGLDSLYSFDQWHQWQEIFSLCHLVVCGRPGVHEEASKVIKNELAKRTITKPNVLKQTDSGYIYFLNSPPLDIASSEIRATIADSDPLVSCSPSLLKQWLPEEVAEYISVHGLYTKNSPC